MTVKEAIRLLLEQPLDAEVVVSSQKDDYHYVFNKAMGVVNYDDGTVGIVGNKED